MLHRFEDCVLCDLVKHDTADIDVFQRFTLAENFFDMPRDGFTFAVRVGREDKRIVAF